MENHQLTSEQIETLFDFCRKHYVEYYDLQVELVDHLATKIEDIWVDKPETSFQKALDQSFGEFGIYGFSKIKVAKQKGLQKKYRKSIWNYIKEYYKLPKIILTAGFTYLIYELFQVLPNQSVLLFIYAGLLAAFTLIYVYHIFPKHYKIKIGDKKKFLCIDVLNGYQATMGMIPVLLLQLPNFLKNFEIHFYPWWAQLLLSIFISGISILMSAYFFYIPKKIQEDMVKQFPQFVKA